MLRDAGGSLSFLVHPELQKVVREEDLSYIESLLGDFLERAKLHPADLFNQLSSLGVGPLVTKQVGWDPTESHSIQELSSVFIRI